MDEGNGNVVELAQTPCNWIVRLSRRSDGRIYYYDHNCSINARISSSMKFTKEVAIQFAHAIATQHKKYSAKAMRFDSPYHKQNKSKTIAKQ